MKRYKKIVIPISLDEWDRGVIRWGSKVTHLAEAARVVFVHPMTVAEIPAEAKEKYPWLREPLDGKILEEMRSKVEKEWEGHADTEVEYRVLDDASEVLAILNLVVNEEADLVVVNRNSFGHDLSIRLARKAPCSVMTVPNNNPVKLEKILVPVDFSDHCRTAVDVSTAFAVAGGIREVESMHVFHTGRYSHRVTLPASELEAMLRESAADEHRTFIDSCDAKGVAIKLEQMCHASVAQAVCREAKRTETDLIVLGCRGKDTMAALLLGSNAEEILRDAPVPVIAAKQKGAGMQLLDALLRK